MIRHRAKANRVEAQGMGGILKFMYLPREEALPTLTFIRRRNQTHPPLIYA
ncbi:hypothetical protein D3C81_2317720 [compost metagenome]